MEPLLLLIFFYFLLFPGPSYSQPAENFVQGKGLKDGDELASANEDFRLGFFKLSGKAYLGIWYNRNNEKPSSKHTVNCKRSQPFFASNEKNLYLLPLKAFDWFYKLSLPIYRLPLIDYKDFFFFLFKKIILFYLLYLKISNKLFIWREWKIG